MEPALAALLAGGLDMNATMAVPDAKKTLAFDIFNGAIGVLNACYVARQMIHARKCKNAMIVAAEIENNAEAFPGELVGIRETASALILDEAPSDHTGFSHFLFRYFTEAMNAYTSYLTTKNGKACLHIDKSANLEAYYLAGILSAVRELLLMEGLKLTEITKIFPPQISSAFIAKLSEAMNLAKDKFVDVVGDGQDLFTSSLPCALQFAHERNLVKVGDIGLIISVGSGIQVGCAVYYF
jgi:3-oxoacyl-[acyl-carrier-protein] synthase III